LQTLPVVALLKGTILALARVTGAVFEGRVFSLNVVVRYAPPV